MKSILSIILVLSFLSDAMLVNRYLFDIADGIEWIELDTEKDSEEKKTEIEDKILVPADLKLLQYSGISHLQHVSWYNPHTSALFREILTPPPELS